MSSNDALLLLLGSHAFSLGQAGHMASRLAAIITTAFVERFLTVLGCHALGHAHHMSAFAIHVFIKRDNQICSRGTTTLFLLPNPI